MIADNGKYYLYRHIRLDTNEVFYVGVGSKRSRSNCFSDMYERSCSRSNRNIFWRRIANKTNFISEVLLESNNREFILIKESEFIKLYGRRDNGTGTLCNLTEGGEGVLNLSLESIKSSSTKRSRKVSSYNILGERLQTFVSVRECANNYKTHRANIRKAVREKISVKDIFFAYGDYENIDINFYTRLKGKGMYMRLKSLAE
jgi:hypothetical protein